MLSQKELRRQLLYVHFLNDVDAGKRDYLDYLEFSVSIMPEYDAEVGQWDTETMKWTDRYRQIQAMHQLICLANNEELYATWVYYVPDEATDDDFISIATSDESFNEAFKLFKKLICDKNYL